MKSESGFSFAMASQPFEVDSEILFLILLMIKYPEKFVWTKKTD